MKILKIRYEIIVNILLVISIAIVLFNDILFGKISKTIFYYSNSIHGLLSNLSLAYISSFIFYYLVVVLKEKRDKKNVYVSVHRSINSILSSCENGTFGYLVECAGGDKLLMQFHKDKISSRSVTKDKLRELCVNIDFKKELDYRSRINESSTMSQQELIPRPIIY